ncbi:hypothetical protein GPECTOR_20g556 [Gonium pectorale]|uniref:Uncharacterized protein n=1 Tax=Gonium pectorale TaxID=33097 RepID=A0A150GIQ5_GONPE|nr:hypothetical protein GPECTOR_20g556 [Gonium pectorale]|eukprot:KXZ49699.1 hypothetical protein GPECTOR_20g556 [Gonium pectorale]
MDEADEDRMLGVPPPCAPGSALAALLYSLPALRAVHLGDFAPVEPIEQRLMFDALAALPALEELGLPYGTALTLLPLLSDRLRRLHLKGAQDIHDTSDPPLTDAVGCILALRRLESLALWGLAGEAATDGLLTLLRNAQPSLQRLELTAWELLGSCCTELTLQAGCISRIAFGWAPNPVLRRCISVHNLALFARQVLLPLEPSRRPVQCLHMEGVIVEGDALGGLDVGALAQLPGSCREMWLGLLRVNGCVQPDEVLQLLRMLGTPEKLALVSGDYQWSVWVKTRRAQLPPEPEPAGSDEQRATVVAAEDVLAATAAVMAASVPLDVAEPRPQLLVLRGPFIAGMAWAEGALDVWMRALSVEAGRMLADPLQRRVDDTGRPLREQPQIHAYLLLPGVAAVLALCGSTLGAAAVEAALGVAGARVRMSTMAAGGPLMFPMLQVVKVAAELLCGTNTTYRCSRIFTRFLDQAAQFVWDGEGFSAGWSLTERLRWLLEQQPALNALQRPVDLQQPETLLRRY